MRIHVILIFFMLFSLHLVGQNQVVLNGKVIDKKTQELLPYATIVHAKKSIGTVSNMNGSFTLSLYNVAATDSIIVSFVGYKPLKTTVSECMQTQTHALEAMVNEIGEIVVTANKLNLKAFVREVIEGYNRNKRKEPHIAIAHYREKAKENTTYIMYMESIGYAVFAGKQTNAAPLSNYKFFCENTKCHVVNPQWTKYKENSKGAHTENVVPGGGSNLNLFRYLESEGLLSKSHYKKFKYKMDSTYYVNNNLVYCIAFKGNIASGRMFVLANSKQIVKMECATTKYWSTAFQKRVDAQVDIHFNYFEEQPFVSSIQAQYNYQKLHYQNDLEILVQKFNQFDLSQNEYWSLNIYDQNPYVEYIPEEWITKNIQGDRDYRKIASDLEADSISMEKEFERYSGRWFFPNSHQGELVKDKVKQLKSNFE